MGQRLLSFITNPSVKLDFFNEKFVHVLLEFKIFERWKNLNTLNSWAWFTLGLANPKTDEKET